MVNENIDVASLLSLHAGHQLAEAYKLHIEMSTKQLPQDEYFSLRTREREACITAVLLFQASMEAIINEELEVEPKLAKIKLENDNLSKKFKMLSFKNKWEKTFEVLKMNSKEKSYLESYLKFYLKFRVPITHAKSRFVDAEKFNYLNVYEGIKNGYMIVETFYLRLGKFTGEHTWENFAKKSSLPV